MKTTEIIVEINKLRTLSDVQEVLTATKKKADIVAQRTWRAGTKVRLLKEYQGRKPYDTVGEITKVNKVKLVIDFGEYGKRWTVPKTMVEAVK